MTSPVVIITGGSSGIGASVVAEFLKHKWTVVIGDRNLQAAEKMAVEAASRGQTVLAKQLDIAKEESVKELVNWTVEMVGRIDAAVNAAGIGGPTLPLSEVEDKDWRQTLDVDMMGTFFFNKALVTYWRGVEPRMLRDDGEYGLNPVYQRGAIVNIASATSKSASAFMGCLTAAKHGVLGVTKSIALENVSFGIRANCVSPGVVFTPIMGAAGFDFEQVKEYVNQQAVKRFSHPDEIAPAIYYLCSDEASFVTGTNISLDAGWTSH